MIDPLVARKVGPEGVGIMLESMCQLEDEMNMPLAPESRIAYLVGEEGWTTADIDQGYGEILLSSKLLFEIVSAGLVYQNVLSQ